MVISRSGNGIYYDVVNIVFHPLFNVNTMANDVAVIELADPITFVPGIIETAALPNTVLRGGDALTMKDGVQVSILNLFIIIIISVIRFVFQSSKKGEISNNWLYFDFPLSICAIHCILFCKFFS